MRGLFTPAASLFVLFSTLDSALAQSWALTSAPSKPWVSLACSADGSRLIAAARGPSSPFAGPIYTSTNSGLTWLSNNVPLQPWLSVACSADGNTLAASSGSVSVYFSTNAGATWATSGPAPRALASVAISADGTKWMASAGSAKTAYTSSNFGAVWSSNYLAGAANPSGVAISADGSKLAVSAAQSAVYTSPDSGATWISNYTAFGYDADTVAGLAGSADSGILSLSPGFGNGGAIYTSTNSGVTWGFGAVHQVWGGIAASAEGTELIAGGYPAIYTSTNSGSTWTSNSAPKLTWECVASSADGTRLVAGAYPGGIYISQSTPSPQLKISLSGNSNMLSWIVPSMNFVLQHNSDLKTTNWVTLTNSPVLNLAHLQEQVTLSRSNTSGFFRLVAY